MSSYCLWICVFLKKQCFEYIWHITLHKFKVYSMLLDTFISCNMFAIIVIFITLLNCSIIVWSIFIMLYIRFLWLIYYWLQVCNLKCQSYPSTLHPLVTSLSVFLWVWLFLDLTCKWYNSVNICVLIEEYGTRHQLFWFNLSTLLLSLFLVDWGFELTKIYSSFVHTCIASGSNLADRSGCHIHRKSTFCGIEELFFIAVITNYHEFGSLKQHNLIIL